MRLVTLIVEVIEYLQDVSAVNPLHLRSLALHRWGFVVAANRQKEQRDQLETVLQDSVHFLEWRQPFFILHAVQITYHDWTPGLFHAPLVSR